MAATLVVAAMLGTWGASTAEATSYRFWAYWLGTDSGWSFSNQGASRRPADGTVDGWRFAVSQAASSTIPPRHSASFARLCGSTPPQEGKKRVGLVVDFGTSADAPGGETPPALLATCVVAPPDANGYAVLAAAVQLRTEAGLICGMNGYPETECGVPVADPTASPSATSGGGSGGSVGGGGSAGAGGSSGPTKSTSPDASAGATGGGDKAAATKRQDKTSDERDGQGKKSASASPDDPSTAADQADATPAAASLPASTSGSPLGLVVGASIVLALLTAAVVVRRRRS